MIGDIQQLAGVFLCSHSQLLQYGLEKDQKHFERVNMKVPQKEKEDFYDTRDSDIMSNLVS